MKKKQRMRHAATPDRQVVDLQQQVASLEQQKAAFEAAMQFAKQVQSPIWNVLDTSTRETSQYTRFTKEQILDYMQSPTSNERNLRNASIYMWDASSQYRRLIQYYALLPRYDYIIEPMDFDSHSVKTENFRKQYLKVQKYVDLMNLPHELQKAGMIVLRDGIFFGAIWKNKTSFYVQRINPDFCSLTSVVDGTFQYSVDMSKIQEKKLPLYPPEFTTMYNNYKATNIRWQEVPLDICFCLKADETTLNYSIPPWASTLPMLYDIETYKALQETATEIANYKILGLQIPLNDDGTPKVDWQLANQYYQQLCSVLPPYVGAFISPMKTESFEFDKSNGTHDVDTVSAAEEQYWFSTGTSALLHGSTVSNTAGALKLSIRADEELMFAFMRQCERLVNRIVKNISGTIKFQIRMLMTTVYNQQEQVQLFKDAATLSIPGAKSAYAASIGMRQTALPGLAYLENNMLDCDEWTPLQNSWTSTGYRSDPTNQGGRPEMDDVDLSEGGEETRAADSNDNR